MSIEKEFKFVISRPLREPGADHSYQYFQIFAAYPTFVYYVALKSGETMTEHEQERLAISELKMRLIKDIVDAKFEREDFK